MRKIRFVNESAVESFKDECILIMPVIILWYENRIGSIDISIGLAWLNLRLGLKTEIAKFNRSLGKR